MSRLLTKAQYVFNKWIRERDKDLPCISCGQAPPEQAGHYFAAGLYSELRFNEINVNGQCVKCNYYKHGNLEHYRNGLINKYGIDKVLLLESAARRSLRKFTRSELELIIKTYKL